MDLQKNHWIALYLSGQYPGKYIIPNKLDILFSIRRIDTSNFGDPTIGLLHGKSDAEYFKSLLDTFEKLHGEEKCIELLEDLNIPEEVRGNPNNKIEQEDEGASKKGQDKDSEALKISKLMHSSIVSKYVGGIKSKLYDGAFIEAFNILNARLKKYCNDKLGKGEAVELDAIDVIFNQSKDTNTFDFKRGTETERGMEDGLKSLFEGLIKYYRNPSAHIKQSIKTEQEYIAAFMLLSSLLVRMDNSKMKDS